MNRSSAPSVVDPCPVGHSVPVLAVVASMSLGIGLALRADGLDRKSLWGDEVLTISRASKPTVKDLLGTLRQSPFPPLYYLMLVGWVGLAGLNDATVRFPALAFGLLAPLATYLAWRPLIGRRASLWALTLLSLNAFHIWYSNDAKMYSLVWLLSTVSCASFLRVVLGPPRWSWWHAAYAGSSAALPLVSYIGFAPLFVQVVYGLGLALLRPDCRGAVGRAAVAGVAALLPFGAWLPVALRATVQRTGIAWIPAAGLESLADLYQLFGLFLLGYQTSGDTRPTSVWAAGLSWVYLLAVLAAAGLMVACFFGALRGDGDRPRPASNGGPEPNAHAPGTARPAVVVFLALWFLLPVVETLAFSLTVYSLWGVPRYLTGAAPALSLWLAVAVGGRQPRAALVLVAPVLAGNLLILAFDRCHRTRIPWREYADCIATVEAVMPQPRGLPAAPEWAELDSESVTLVVRQDRSISPSPIAHAIAVRSPGREVLDRDSRVAGRFGVPFILIHRYPALAKPNPVHADDLPPEVPGFVRRRLRRDTVYEGRFSVAPTPFAPYTVELWSYVPRPADADNLPEGWTTVTSVRESN
jgi:mannosyltransferase